MKVSYIALLVIINVLISFGFYWLLNTLSGPVSPWIGVVSYLLLIIISQASSSWDLVEQLVSNPEKAIEEFKKLKNKEDEQ